jgi:hypothetical protein
LWQRWGAVVAAGACALAISVIPAVALAEAASGAASVTAVASSSGSVSSELVPTTATSAAGSTRASSTKPPSVAPAKSADSSHRSAFLRALLGLAAAVVLAIVAAHPRVRAIETRFGLTIAIASGLPFLLLGVVFRDPRVDVLDASVLHELEPFVEFGLGWVGFVVGLELDVRKLEHLPERTSTAVVLEGLLPFTLVGAGALFATWALGRSPLDATHARDALVLGACAALSAATAPLALARGAGRKVAHILDRIAQLDDVLALIVLLVLGAFLRPVAAQGWTLPATAWAFLTLGLGGVLGGLSWALIRGARTEREELALTLGAVAFSAGVAGRLAMAPLVVCAIAGALLANLPRRRGAAASGHETLRIVERPVVLLLLVITGATAPFESGRLWVLAGAYLALRAVGKVLGVALARRSGPSELRDAPGVTLALMPQSAMSFATALSAFLLYARTDDGRLATILGAVVAASFVNDVAVQLVAQRVNRLSPDVIDEAVHAISLPPPHFDDDEDALALPPPVSVPRPPRAPSGLGPQPEITGDPRDGGSSGPGEQMR